MAIGKSGKIIIELTPEQKSLIHKEIRKEGKTMKAWFLEKALEDFPEIKELMESKDSE